MPPKGKTAGKSTSSSKGSAARGGKSGREAAAADHRRPAQAVGADRDDHGGGAVRGRRDRLRGLPGERGGKNTPEAKAAAAREIDGIVLQTYPGGQHNDGTIRYDQSPPFGGAHANAWADCTGTVYPSPIRQENAVHSQEHGAVWITYRPDLPGDQVDALRKRVDGVEQMLMSPYPGLKSAVSLQAWGHQLFVDSASDARIEQFIDDLRLNPTVAPEPNGSCVNPQFKGSPLPPDPSGAAGSSAAAPAGSGGAATPTPSPTRP